MTAILSKRQLLEAYLGNFNEYIFTGWMFDNDETDLTNADNWECYWKTPIYPLTDFKLDQLPEILTKCHCTTPIIWNCLIKHTPTGRLEFVGSVCMHYFEMNLKRCIQCNIPNRCPTRRCSTCRTRCKLHGEYHDDNAVHTRTRVADVPRSFDERPLTFGKFKSWKPQQLLNQEPHAESYFYWLFKCDLLTEADKTELGLYLYGHGFPPKGKYCYAPTTFKNIKKHDTRYYDWLKRTWTDAFVEYLP